MSENQLAILRNLAENYVVVKENFFNYSLIENEYDKNLEIDQSLREIILPLLQKYLEKFKIISVSFLVKPARFETEMDLHQDWNSTFENKFTPLTLWIPLQKTTEQNGGLFFLPGSHKFCNNFRSLDYQTSRLNRNQFDDKDIVEQNADDGDLIFFHPGVFHGSFTNQSHENRIIVSAIILPMDAPYIYAKKHTETEALIEYIDEDKLFSDLSKIGSTDIFNGSRKEIINYSHQEISIEKLKRKNALQ